MTSSLLLLQLFLASCLAQDSGLYVNKVAIHARMDDAKQYTYLVEDNYEDIQTTQFQNEAPTIGRVYEDDYAPDSTPCKTVECPKLRKIYAQVNKVGGKVTFTRIIDAEMKKSVVGDVKAMGYVAPYPGYCSSDDSQPLVELFSDSLQSQFSSMASSESVFQVTPTGRQQSLINSSTCPPPRSTPAATSQSVSSAMLFPFRHPEWSSRTRLQIMSRHRARATM